MKLNNDYIFALKLIDTLHFSGQINDETYCAVLARCSNEGGSSVGKLCR